MSKTWILAAIAATALVASLGAQAPAAWSLKIEPAMLAAARGSSEPQLTVSPKGVLVSWVETEDKSELKFAERTAAGWSQPIVAASGDDWFLNESDVPSVLHLSNGTLVASWPVTTNDELEAYDLHLSYSKDGGKTWAKSFMPHHDGTQTEHGFVSLFELPTKNLGLVYLDGRGQVKDREHGPMSLRYASYDAQWKQTADAAMDLKVCDCCPTSVAVSTDGPIVAYRNRTDAEIRDIYVSRLEAGKWTAGTPVHNDNWHVEACPVNGPAISTNGRNAAIAWFTTQKDQGEAFAALSSDGGKTWGAPVRLDDEGSLGRVDIETLDDGSAVATWVEFANKRGQFRARHIDKAGVKSAPVTIAGAANGRIAGIPHMARAGNQLVFAWTETPENGGIGIVKTAVAALPR